MLLVLGGTSLMTGIRPRLGVGAVALFLIPVTLIMHNFWALQGIQAEIEQYAFMGNVGLFGAALLFMAIPQPWAASLDQRVLARIAMLPRLRESIARRHSTSADAYLPK